RVEQVDLPATVLLGRRADDLDGDLEALRFGRGEQEGADVRHGDEVVAAAVTDTGERVVLGEERHALPRGADARSEGGRQTADAHLHRVPVRAQQRRRARGG